MSTEQQPETKYWGPESIGYTPTHFPNAYAAYRQATDQDHLLARQILFDENIKAWDEVNAVTGNNPLAIFEHTPTAATEFYAKLVVVNADRRKCGELKQDQGPIAEENRLEAMKVVEEVHGKATGIEAKVCLDITRRQKLGIEKYGQTVADNPAKLKEWLQHAYEETLDQAVYLRRAMEEISGME